MTPEELQVYSLYDPEARMLDHKIDYAGNKIDTIKGLYPMILPGGEKVWHCKTQGGSRPSIDRIRLRLKPMSGLVTEDEEGMRSNTELMNHIKKDNQSLSNRDVMTLGVRHKHSVLMILAKNMYDVFDLIGRGLADNLNKKA